MIKNWLYGKIKCNVHILLCVYDQCFGFNH